MDAYAHLRGLGWKGAGFSLGRSNNGLKKPILVTHKTDLHGIGLKQQKERQADQWWLDTFDSTLKDIGSNSNRLTSTSSIALSGPGKSGLGLDIFISGTELDGTFDSESTTSLSTRAYPARTSATLSPSRLHLQEPIESSLAKESPKSSPKQRDGSSDSTQQLELKRPSHKSVASSKSQEPNPEPCQQSELKKPSNTSVTSSTFELSTMPSQKQDIDKKRKASEEAVQDNGEGPAEKKVKIIEGIAIPKPTPIRKNEKKKHVPARVIRAQQREERKEEARRNAIEKRKKQIEEGTFDWEADELRRKERQLNQMVKAEIMKRERAGEFGVVLPHPSVMLKMEKEAHARGEPFIHPSKLGYDIPPDTPFEKCKKVSYKAEKYKREKLKREAKRDVKARLRALMFGEEYIPETNLTPEEKKQRRLQEKEKARAERRARREAKALAEAEREARLEAERMLEKEEQKEPDIERESDEQSQDDEALDVEPDVQQEDEKSEKHEEAEEGNKTKKTVPTTQEEDEQSAPVTQNIVSSSEEEPKGGIGEELIKPSTAVNGFDISADEIKLGVNVAGRVKKVPGLGRIDKYPTKSEKKQKKLQARADEAGMTLEEYKAKLEKERVEAEAPEKARLAELRASRGGLDAKQWHRYRRFADEEGEEKAEEYFIECVRRNKAMEEAKANGVKLKKPEPQAPLPVLGADDAHAPMTNGHVSSKDEASDSDAEPKQKMIPKKKMEKYAAKAAAKGVTVEEYIERHEFKKAKIAARQATAAIKASRIQVMEDKVDVEILPTNPPAASVKTSRSSSFAMNGAKHAYQQTSFIVDTAGDASLDNTKPPTAQTHFVVDAGGDPELKKGPPKLIWHPDMLSDRRVKDLSKAERQARLEWMRERRAAKHAAAGRTNVLSKKERHKKKVERKMKQRDRLVAEIMREKGKPREEVTKEELMDARRKAKRIQRELKREKRNKVIFRKKLGGGLRGLLGAKISQGGAPRYDLIRLGQGGMAPMG